MTLDTFEGAQKDPLSLHKYVYCKDNPVNNVDPSGHAAYVRTRPLDIDVVRHFPDEAVHVFLQFDKTFFSQSEADEWDELVRNEDDPASSLLN